MTLIALVADDYDLIITARYHACLASLQGENDNAPTAFLKRFAVFPLRGSVLP